MCRVPNEGISKQAHEQLPIVSSIKMPPAKTLCNHNPPPKLLCSQNNIWNAQPSFKWIKESAGPLKWLTAEFRERPQELPIDRDFHHDDFPPSNVHFMLFWVLQWQGQFDVFFLVPGIPTGHPSTIPNSLTTRQCP